MTTAVVMMPLTSVAVAATGNFERAFGPVGAMTASLGSSA
jgi:hypothetical protein